jgi:hypothetical protein
MADAGSDGAKVGRHGALSLAAAPRDGILMAMFIWQCSLTWTFLSVFFQPNLSLRFSSAVPTAFSIPDSLNFYEVSYADGKFS